MSLPRRTFLAGAAALAIAPVAARAAASPYAAAAAYSAASDGVSMLVMQDGKILFEDYPNGGAPEKGWELASGTKSFTGIIAAAAAADGFLSIDEFAADTLGEWRADPLKAKIRIRHLLSLTSGVDPGGVARAPTYADAVAAPARWPAGEKFEYGPTAFQIFGEIMRRKLTARGAPADPVAYLRTRVLDRVGVAPTAWRKGSDDNPLMPQGAQFTARAWGKFGQWVLDGCSGVDPSVARALFEASPANPGYGLSWWLLRPGLIGPDPRAGVGRSLGVSAPEEDIVMAAGAGNQRLYLLRKRRLIVVRQADHILAALLGRGPAWSDVDFLKALLA